MFAQSAFSGTCGCVGGRGQCTLFRISALCLCLELFISGGLVVFVFTKELSVFIMCGGFMTLRVYVISTKLSLVALSNYFMFTYTILFLRTGHDLQLER